MDGSGERRSAAVLAAVFALMALLSVVDLLSDLNAGTAPRHALAEGALVLLGLAGFWWMARRFQAIAARARRFEHRAAGLEARLEATRRDAERWSREAAELIGGLGQAIERQLERWGLSPAEREVARLLLKGLSHKEIAEVREVGEATVRQQARALYKKAGLGGRHDLAAFFLEDLLDPQAFDPDRRSS